MDKLTAALRYAELGWEVVPLHSIDRNKNCTCHKGRTCDNVGKHPHWHSSYLPNGLKNATSDSEQVRQWWTLWPDANIGIVTGAGSGFIALDVDTKENKEGQTGLDTLNAFVKEYGEIPSTVTATTGSGGKHILFKYPEWHVSNKIGSLGHGLDIKGDGGYIIVSPSTHKSGDFYKWDNGCSPLDVEFAQMPAWLEAFLERETRKVYADREAYEGRVWKKYLSGTKIGEGTRNETLFQIGAAMRGKGACYEDILATLAEVNNTRVVPPVEHEEINTLAESAASYRARIVGDVQGEQGSLLVYPDTDFGNAERLVQRHGIDLKYCFQWDTWLIWDGVKWGRDEHYEIYRRALETIRATHEEALEVLHILDEEIKQLNKDSLSPQQQQEIKNKYAAAKKRVQFSRNSEFKARTEAMVNLAKTLAGIPVSVDALDANKYIINVLNGTYDLQADTLRPHNRNDLITKVANVEYAPTNKAPRWKQFITEVMNTDREMVNYIQRVCGLLLSGDTSEEHLFVPHGSGGNGKSKFIAGLMNVLGDYGQQAPSSLLMVNKRDGSAPNPDLVRIRGARFVSTSETSDGKSLDEELVKILTGNDLITARGLHENPISFRPEAKFFISTNHKPLIRGTDNGIWRRVLLIPFEVSFSEAQKDTHLEEKLVAEVNGIFNWMLEGYRLWKKAGVKPPTKIIAATAGYRAEMDSLGNFLDDCCVLHQEAKCPIKDLYPAYQTWCIENGERAMNNRMLKKRLEERGFEQQRTNKGRFWTSIGLLISYPHLVNQESDKSDNNDKKTDKKIEMKTQSTMHLEKNPENSVTSVTFVTPNSNQMDMVNLSKKETAATIPMDYEEGEL